MENMTIKMGKSQWNSKSAKAFRDSLAKYDCAVMELADTVCIKQEKVKALRTLIDSDEKTLAKIADGTIEHVTESAEKIQSKIDANVAEIARLDDEIAEYKKTLEPRVADGLALVEKNGKLYSAYKNYIEKDDADNYRLAMAQFLLDNGVEPCEDTIARLMRTVGDDTTSNKEKVGTNAQTRAYKFGKYQKLFIGKLCDLLKADKVIAPHKFTYVLKKDRKTK